MSGEPFSLSPIVGPDPAARSVETLPEHSRADAVLFDRSAGDVRLHPYAQLVFAHFARSGTGEDAIEIRYSSHTIKLIGQNLLPVLEALAQHRLARVRTSAGDELFRPRGEPAVKRIECLQEPAASKAARGDDAENVGRRGPP